MVIGPWEHAITPTVGDLKFPNNKFDYNALAWRFFSHWLKDDSSNVMDEPAVHYYVMGDCDNPSAPGNCWRTADNWPPFPTRETAYYLSSDGELVTQRDSLKAGKREYDFDPASPCPSQGGNDAVKPLPLDQRSIGARDDVLKFATEPLLEPVEVTGPVRVKLFITSDAPDTDFTAKMVDIYPDGREIAILNGIQRVKFRNGFEKPDPLPIGSVGEVTLDCWSTSIIFNKGHRIGLHISSSNWPRYEVNPNTGADLPSYKGQSKDGDWLIDPKSLRVAHNTVLMDKLHPSSFILPVAPPNPPESLHARQANGAATKMVIKMKGRERLQKPRVEPVRKESWTNEQRAILQPLEQTGRLYNVFTTMANHPALAADWLVFARHVLNHNSLPARDREILIIRIGWLCRSEYEWAQHVRIGKAAGLTDEEIREISVGPEGTGWKEHDRLLLKAADELHDDAFISDLTWEGLTNTYNTEQMMDLVFTIGQYNLVSMALNSFGVQLDEGLQHFPN